MVEGENCDYCRTSIVKSVRIWFVSRQLCFGDGEASAVDNAQVRTYPKPDLPQHPSTPTLQCKYDRSLCGWLSALLAKLPTHERRRPGEGRQTTTNFKTAISLLIFQTFLPGANYIQAQRTAGCVKCLTNIKKISVRILHYIWRACP